MTAVKQVQVGNDFRALFVLQNWATAETGATVAAETEASDSLSQSKLTDGRLDTAWRSTNLSIALAGARRIARSDARILIEMGAPRRVDMVGIFRHNVRLPWRASLYRDNPAGAKPLITSAWTNPIIRPAFEDYTFDTFDFPTGPTIEEVDRLAAGHELDSLILFDTPVSSVRWVEIAFDLSGLDQAGKPRLAASQDASYLQVSLPWIGETWRPTINVDLGWRRWSEDLSTVRRTDTGNVVGRRRPTVRRIAFSLGYAEYDEAFERLLAEWVDSPTGGRLGQVFFWMEPHRPRYFRSHAMVGYVDKLPVAEMAHLDWPAANGWEIAQA